MDNEIFEKLQRAKGTQTWTEYFLKGVEKNEP
jgi:hypothetical protein